ncbi:MAG TPA: cobalamin-dependent protein [Sphaerochaeta sp.]|nr:cobalamin-dependent protein [Sphaerochaeta sp.]
MDDRRKQLMFQDILYNFSFLSTAVRLQDAKIFASYAVWLFELLCNLMRDLDRDRIKNQMIDHYRILSSFTGELFSAEEANLAEQYLDRAIEVTLLAMNDYPVSKRFMEGKHVAIRKQYLDALMRNDTMQALALIRDTEKLDIPLEEIYEDVLMEVMHEVGELWHKNIITVDKEHYCTSTTQMVLSSFYPRIFGNPKHERRIVTCSVGSELHEMGGRMVSDLFEYHGWDSIYLGAAVPAPALIHAVEEYKPEIVALSVTMPQHLEVCRNLVFALREAFPELCITVGGRAFETSDKIYQKWPITYYSVVATELLSWVESGMN